jgi:hypothetical protein
MATEWFVEKAGELHGPFSSERLKELVGQGKLQSDDDVRKGRDGKVMPAGSVKGLFENNSPKSESVISLDPVTDSKPRDQNAISASNGWYCVSGSQRLGPVALSHLKALASKGELKPDELVWHETLPDWQQARQVGNLFSPDQISQRSTLPPPLPTPKAGQKPSSVKQPTLSAVDAVASPAPSSVIRAPTATSQKILAPWYTSREAVLGLVLVAFAFAITWINAYSPLVYLYVLLSFAALLWIIRTLRVVTCDKCGSGPVVLSMGDDANLIGLVFSLIANGHLRQCKACGASYRRPPSLISLFIGLFTIGFGVVLCVISKMAWQGTTRSDHRVWMFCTFFGLAFVIGGITRIASWYKYWQSDKGRKGKVGEPVSAGKLKGLFGNPDESYLSVTNGIDDNSPASEESYLSVTNGIDDNSPASEESYLSVTNGIDDNSPASEGATSIPTENFGFLDRAKASAKNLAVLAAKQASIQKLSFVDLPAADHATGLKALTHNLGKEQFASTYDEIAQIDAQVAELRKTEETASTDTITDRMMRVGRTTAKFARVEKLLSKRKRLVTTLGSQLRISTTCNSDGVLDQELARARIAEQSIEKLNEEVQALGKKQILFGTTRIVAAIVVVCFFLVIGGWMMGKLFVSDAGQAPPAVQKADVEPEGRAAVQQERFGAATEAWQPRNETEREILQHAEATGTLEVLKQDPTLYYGRDMGWLE